MKSIILQFLLCVYLPLYAQTIYFQDDFQDGDADGWQLGQGWQVVDENGNYAVQSSGQSGFTPHSEGWGKHILEFRFKPVRNFQADAMFIDVKHSGNSYYHFAFFSSHILFNKITNGTWQWEEHKGPSSAFHFDLGSWYTLKFELMGSVIRFYIDDQLLIEYNDSSSPLLFGSFHIFTFFDFQALFDDFVVSGEAPERQGQWVRTGGPWGGIGYDVRIDPTNPDIMYVTDQWAGNHKSINGGLTWYPNNIGIHSVFGSTGESVPIFCLTIDPNDTRNIWCGTFNSRGIYRSTDYGETWDLKIHGIPRYKYGITFRGFGIRPGNSNVVFCAVEITCGPNEIPPGKKSASRGKVFKSEDFGESWREVLDSDALCRHVLFDPRNPDIMYVSTGIFDRDCIKEEGVWKSTDGGETWFHANNNLTDLTVGGLFVDPLDPDILWASTGREPEFGGDGTSEIFKSVDQGESWMQMYPRGSQQPGWDIASITSSPVNSQVVYAASEGLFYASRNGGSSWQITSYDISGIYTGIPVGIAAHPTDENKVFINSYSGGVFASKDGGRSWNPFNTGYTGAEEMVVSVHPKDPMQVLAVGRAGIARSDNGGMTWEGAGELVAGGDGFGAGPIAEQTDLIRNPQNPTSFLCGAFWGPPLLRTTDQFHWTIAHDFKDDGVRPDLNRNKNHGIGAIAYDPADTNTIYVGFRTTTLPLIIDRPEEPFDPTKTSYGLFKSTDNGESWTTMNHGLEGTTMNIETIAIHPSNSDILYIGIYGHGVYKSVDAGASWTRARDGILSYLINTIVLDPQDPNTLYAGAEDGGVYKSVDAGAQWHPSFLGMDPEASVRSIVIDPIHPNHVYAADWHSGVYSSTDGGQVWFPFNTGLTTRSVQDLAISTDGQTLYAATQGQGVFRLSFENLGPFIQYSIPDNHSMLTFSTFEDQEFIIGALDYNGDPLTYTWLLDGKSVPDIDGNTLMLKTSGLAPGSYTLSCQVSDGKSTQTLKWNFFINFSTDMAERNPREYDYALEQNYPNPFNNHSRIRFGVREQNRVILKLYDILGREVTTLTDQSYVPGHYHIDLDAANLSTGLYFYCISIGDFKATRKAILVK